MTVLERLWKEVALPRLKLPPRDLPGGKQKVGEERTMGGIRTHRLLKKITRVNDWIRFCLNLLLGCGQE